LGIGATGAVYFYNKVKYGGAWDYKLRYGYSTKYIFHGKTITGSDFGNIHYGYVGSAAGFSPITLKTAAGFAQALHNYGSYNPSKMNAYFDEPRDTKMKQLGIDMYNKDKKTHPWWLPLIF
jgi:hypothetical protein